jgi:rubrerythrin
MGFNPFSEKGKKIEDQIQSWPNLNVKPYDSRSVHPYTRTRGILMNGIETEAVFFYHNFHRHTDNLELRQKLAMIRRIEQQEQKMVNWMIPAQESTIEVTIGYEQLAVDLTACMAKTEPDKYVKQALDFGLIEDFDHLYRYANLLALEDERKAEAIVKDLTEIMPGRSTIIEHLHPFDTIRKYYNKDTADVITKLHVSTITAAEQQTMNFYMNVGNRIADETGRGLYQEIAEIEEQHVTHYGALEDPRASWFEMAVLHEYNECYMYWSCMESEVDSQVKMFWQQCLENEIAHLHAVVDIMKQYEKKDATEQYPKSFPEPLVLASSKDYVRQVIADQFQLTTDQTQFVPLSNAENRDRYDMYQSKVNGGAYVPSQQVIVNTIQTKGQDYRLETEGQNPLDILRDRKGTPDREKLIRYCLSK